MKALGFAAGILILNLGPIPQVAAQTDDSCEAKAAHIVTQRGDTLAAKIRAAYPDSFANLDDARLTAIFHNELPCLASAESKGEAANQWGGTFSDAPKPAPQPIRQSAERAAETVATQPTPPLRRADDSGPYIASGAALLGTGVVLEILSYTALKEESYACVGIGFYANCVTETSTNIPVLVAGAALAATGGVLWDIGWHKHIPNSPQIMVGRGRFGVTQSIPFKPIAKWIQNRQ